MIDKWIEPNTATALLNHRANSVVREQWKFSLSARQQIGPLDHTLIFRSQDWVRQHCHIIGNEMGGGCLKNTQALFWKALATLRLYLTRSNEAYPFYDENTDKSRPLKRCFIPQWKITNSNIYDS